MIIYLAGRVPKGDEAEKTFVDWRARYSKVIKKHMEAEIIDPYKNHVDESDYMSVVGTDSRSIRDCNLVLVNAEDRLGVGTSQEMLIAKYFKKPVMTVLPKKSVHRRSNIKFFGKIIKDWTHPFIHEFSDVIIEHIEEFHSAMEKMDNLEVKDLSHIDKAIDYSDNLLNK